MPEIVLYRLNVKKRFLKLNNVLTFYRWKIGIDYDLSGRPTMFQTKVFLYEYVFFGKVNPRRTCGVLPFFLVERQFEHYIHYF